MVYLIYRWAGDDFSRADTNPSGEAWIALDIPQELADLALEIANTYIALSWLCSDDEELHHRVRSEFMSENTNHVNLVLAELERAFHSGRPTPRAADGASRRR